MNYERWQNLLNARNPLEAMDWRHVNMINAVLTREPFSPVVSIGCANGFSCSAIVEALESGLDAKAYFVDSYLRDSLKIMVDESKVKHKIQLNQMNSADFFCDEKGGVWIIDGDHREQGTADYVRAMDHNASIIIIHDTNPQCCPDSQFGSIEAGKRLRESADVWWQDWKHRPQENTSRGITIGFFYVPKPETIVELNRLDK